MPYNVDQIEIVAQDGFRLPIEHVDSLRREIGDEHPELWLFDDNPGTFQLPPPWEDRDSYRYFKALRWHGEGSGYSWTNFVEKVLPRFQGWADLVVTWEGGDSFTGLRVRNGVVTEHRVVMTLGEAVK